MIAPHVWSLTDTVPRSTTQEGGREAMAALKSRVEVGPDGMPVVPLGLTILDLHKIAVCRQGNKGGGAYVMVGRECVYGWCIDEGSC